MIINENVRGSDVFVVQPTSDPVNDNLMVYHHRRFEEGFGEQDNSGCPFYGMLVKTGKAGQEPITAKLVANLLESAGADRF